MRDPQACTVTAGPVPNEPDACRPAPIAGQVVACRRGDPYATARPAFAAFLDPVARDGTRRSARSGAQRSTRPPYVLHLRRRLLASAGGEKSDALPEFA